MSYEIFKLGTTIHIFKKHKFNEFLKQPEEYEMVANFDLSRDVNMMLWNGHAAKFNQLVNSISHDLLIKEINIAKAKELILNYSKFFIKE